MKRIDLIRIIIIALFIGSCSSGRTDSDHDPDSDNHRVLYATFFNHFASEYKALSYQAYNVAKQRVSDIRVYAGETKTMAIVVDIDETILDNSPHQAQLIETGTSYPEYWNEWCTLEKAEPVPGALDFLRFADSLDFKIFYISNRKKVYLEEATFNNLARLGFPQLDRDQILLREDISDKEQRRDRVESMGYEIVLMVGDNLGDFYTDSPDYKLREAGVEKMKEEFGRKYIVLPNAMYGNWPESIGLNSTDMVTDSLLNIMTEKFK